MTCGAFASTGGSRSVVSAPGPTLIWYGKPTYSNTAEVSIWNNTNDWSSAGNKPVKNKQSKGGVFLGGGATDSVMAAWKFFYDRAGGGDG